MSTRTTDADYRIAAHMAGHVALLIEQGMDFKHVTIEPGAQADAWVCTLYEVELDEQGAGLDKEWVKNQIRVCLAGPMVAARFHGLCDVDFEGDGRQNRMMILDLLGHISRDSERRNLLMTKLMGEIQTLMESPPIWAGIESLTRALVRRRRMTYREARRVYCRAHRAA